ncbi:hypothetical protein HAX54_010618 [Datura stramonium]|uniref:HD-Zip IV C-terminal domain-containing protein n=1 Tax=Datura stramonium TaxID=4076 RepID=A0ABS8TIG6_DATST|nr:hypothetical protein [Datura stramonium]
MKEDTRYPMCNRCGNRAIISEKSVDENQIKFENDRLKDEVKRISVLKDKLLGPSTSLKGSMASMKKKLNLEFVGEKNFFDASAAMNELLRLAEIGESLWVRSLVGGGETLNLEEYARLFTPFTGMKPGHFTTEATRTSGIVNNNSLTLVKTLMDKGNDTRADQNNMMILRNAFMDATRSILVYAIINSLAKNVVMNGEDCSLAMWNCNRSKLFLRFFWGY